MHKKQTFWQIWVPLIACLLIFIFLAVLVILFTTRDVTGDFNTKWAGISIVFLSLPAIFTSFIFLVIICALIYLTAKIISQTPAFGQKILRFFYQVQNFVMHWGDKAVKPVVIIKSKWHGFSRIFAKKSH
jgi:hypothetical protein